VQPVIIRIALVKYQQNHHNKNTLKSGNSNLDKILNGAREGLIVGRGQNRKVIPPDEIWKLAALGATMEEMSDWFGINRETLKYNFSDYIAKGRAELKRRLRSAQIKTALEGNATLLIWLGKQYLGQQDQPTNNEDNQPLPWVE
jgi:hypothetical protein